MINRKASKQSGFTLIEIIATVVIVSVFLLLMLTLLSRSLIKSSDPLRRILKSSDLRMVMANISADYTPYPTWKASTIYAVGNKVLPTGMNGRFYICKTGGTSFTSEPPWSDSGDTPDGSVTWKAGVWVASTLYAAGDIVIPISPNGHFYRCVTGGTSGLAEPAWLLKVDTTFTDGGVTWERLLKYLSDRIGAPDPVNKKNNTWYGKYYVLENRFVKFVSKTMQPISTGDAENVLEVKIQSVSIDGTDRPGEQILTALFTANEN